MPKPMSNRFFFRLIRLGCLALFLCSSSTALCQQDFSLDAIGLSSQEFEEQVKEYVGTPYRKGGSSGKGFDCSGFSRLIYDRLFGIDLPHSSRDQYQHARLRRIDDRQRQAGDLIFFAAAGKKRINHVGVYLSDGQFIHASSSLGITISSLDERYWQARYVGSKRYVPEELAAARPAAAYQATLELPVWSDGMLSGFSQEAIRLDPLLCPEDEPGMAAAVGPCLADSAGSYWLGHYEIGYAHLLADSLSVGLSAVHQRLDSSSVWRGLDSHALQTDWHRDYYAADPVNRQGMKMTGVFSPGTWLSIMPSIAYSDVSEPTDWLAGSSNWLFGLNTRLTPEGSDWSISMLMLYSDRDESADRGAFDALLASLDVELKLGIALNDKMQLSVTGRQERSFSRAQLDDDTLALPVQDVLFSLDLKY